MDGFSSPLTGDHSDAERTYQLALRLGTDHARQRLTTEHEREALFVSRSGKHLHPENLYSMPTLVRLALSLGGLYQRAVKNSRSLRVTRNRFVVPGLPPALEGYTLLQLSDLHVDMDEANLHAVIEIIRELDYDLCVITGDYRRDTWGDINPAMDGMRRLRPHLKGTPLAILGNHDSVLMVPEMESMGYRLLMNESLRIKRGGEALWIAGVDDPHLYRTHDLAAATRDIPPGALSLLLSHTPEIHIDAADAGFDLYLCGHTHGGQLCLPGGMPLTLDAKIPRRLGRGLWTQDAMQGYTTTGAGTSILNVRLNCPPEVTLHQLSAGPDPSSQ
ncbi:metallophosphoesterase [Salicola sp. Rm-C-2C1-2]|uniref:metallophosphoesterase n=1 Tax=Salicola sp. Rm-C-2C1-2 TaxID=3141321 RepID=UPI0032E4CE69